MKRGDIFYMFIAVSGLVMLLLGVAWVQLLGFVAFMYGVVSWYDILDEKER